MPAAQKARVFRNGRSQAVRIPAEYRFTTEEVYIERNPDTGALTLSEKPGYGNDSAQNGPYAEYNDSGHRQESRP